MRIDDTHNGEVKFSRITSSGAAHERLRPPVGEVPFVGFTRNLSMGSLLRRVNPQSPRMTTVAKLAILQNEEIRENYDYCMAQLPDLLLLMNYTITSGFRTQADNTYSKGSSNSDHLIALAFDISFGDYDTTKAAVAAILDRAKNMRCVRQVIFENVRGTTHGYHVHIGFYPPKEKGEVQSLMWYSKKTRQKFVAINNINEIPAKGEFEENGST